MKKIIPYLLLFLFLVVAIYLLYQNNRLQEDVAQLGLLQEQSETLLQADSLYFSARPDDARAAWQTTDQYPLFLSAVELRIAHLEEVDSISREEAAARDSLQSLLGYYQRVRQTDNATINNQQQRIMELQKNVEILSESKQALEQFYALQLAYRDSAIAAQLEKIEGQAAQIAELEQKAETKQVLKFKSPSNVDIIYMGEVKNGKANGYGAGLWANGIAYTGYWKDGEKHGLGLYEYPNGEKFEGTFVNNKRHGFGTYYWKNGDYYKGFWEEDLRHGEGFIINTKGQIVQSGIWKKDQLVEKAKVDI